MKSRGLSGKGLQYVGSKKENRSLGTMPLLRLTEDLRHAPQRPTTADYGSSRCLESCVVIST